jgi:hypothetical protein
MVSDNSGGSIVTFFLPFARILLVMLVFFGLTVASGIAATSGGIDTPQGSNYMPIAIGGHLIAGISNAGIGLSAGQNGFESIAIGVACTPASDGTTIMKASSNSEQGMIECVADSSPVTGSTTYHWQAVGNGQLNSNPSATACDQTGQLNWSGKQVQVCNGTKFVPISVSGGGQFTVAGAVNPAVMDTTTGQTFQWSSYTYNCHVVAGHSSFMCFSGCTSSVTLCATGWNWQQIAAPLSSTPQRNQKYQLTSYSTADTTCTTVEVSGGMSGTHPSTSCSTTNKTYFQAVDSDSGVAYNISGGSWAPATVSVCGNNCYTGN